MTRPTVAVVGAGVAGLTAAYLLQRRYDVTLFEAGEEPGGHAHTHDVATGDGGVAFVDSGFIVHNELTYPTLLRLFGDLGVPTQDAEMSMSVRCAGCGLEYAGARGFTGLFPAAHRPARAGWRWAARPNLARARYLRMLAEVPRFQWRARALLAAPGDGEPTLGEFLAHGHHSRYFVDHYVLPVVSAVWSAGAEVSARYPARYLFRFLAHHGMLGLGGSPTWRTVVGGSRRYVEQAVKGLSAVEVSTPVRAVRRLGPGEADGVLVHDDSDAQRRFHRVVLATHPDQALEVLADPTGGERTVLGAFRYSRNEVWLHGDTSLLPRAPQARASWNYLKRGCPTTDSPVLVSYHMNRLQRLTEPTDYLVTLNGADRVAPETVLARMVYEHPIYTPESVAAQRRLPELNTATTAYAGAYHGWGFHEDGCAAGARAAAAFGVDW